MRRFRWIIGIGILVLLVAATVIGCGGTTTTTTAAGTGDTTATTAATGDTTATTGGAAVGGKGVDTANKTIKIALLGPLSGQSAEYGKSQERGSKTFEKLELPIASGPYAGYTVVFESFDGKADPKEAANIAQKIVMGDYFAVVGSSLSLESLAAAPILDREGIALYTTFSSSDKLTSSGWKNVVMSFPVAPKEGAAIADVVVNDLGKKKVVEFYENSPYGQGLHEGFVAEMTALGGETLKSYTNDAKADVDFSAQLTEIKNMGAEAIVLNETYEAAGLIMGQARKMGIDLPIVACSGAYGDTAVEMAGGEDVLGEVYWLSLYSPDSSRPKVQTFAEEYAAENDGMVPDDAAALTYDALIGIKAALEQGVTTREELAAKLRSGTMTAPEGVTNPAISHDAEGNILDSKLLKIIFKDGKFQLAPGQ